MSRDLLHVELVFRSAVSYFPSSLSPSLVRSSVFAAVFVVKVTETFVAYFKARM